MPLTPVVRHLPALLTSFRARSLPAGRAAKMETGSCGTGRPGTGLPGLPGKPLLERWGAALPDVPGVLGLSGSARLSRRTWRERNAASRGHPTAEACEQVGGADGDQSTGRYGQFCLLLGYPECPEHQAVSLGITWPRSCCGRQHCRARSKRGPRLPTRARTTPTAKSSSGTRPVRRTLPECPGGRF